MEYVQAGICVACEDFTAVLQAVRNLPRRGGAFVRPPVDGWSVVYEELSETPDDDRLVSFTALLSGTLLCTAFGWMVYESDVLVTVLAREGALLDRYNSWPDYFDETLQTDDSFNTARSARLLAEATVRRDSEASIREVLDGDYDFAEERLFDLALLLGLPGFVARWGYGSLRDDLASVEVFTHVAAPFRVLNVADAQ